MSGVDRKKEREREGERRESPWVVGDCAAVGHHSGTDENTAASSARRLPFSSPTSKNNHFYPSHNTFVPSLSLLSRRWRKITTLTGKFGRLGGCRNSGVREPRRRSQNGLRGSLRSDCVPPPLRRLGFIPPCWLSNIDCRGWEGATRGYVTRLYI